MLQEMAYLRHIPDDPRRRWFNSLACDLVVWYSESDVPIGFQLCYDKGRAPKAFTWQAPNTYSHKGVDDGEGRAGHHKATPLLGIDEHIDVAWVTALFQQESAALPADVVELVISQLTAYPGHEKTRG